MSTSSSFGGRPNAHALAPTDRRTATFAASSSAGWRQWCALPAPVVMFESPHRLAATFADLLEVCGPDRELTVARELTKRFEEIGTFRLGEASAWLAADSHREQGEFVLIVHAEPEAAADEDADPAHDVLLDALLESLSVRDAARVAAKVTGQPRDVLYNRALARKKTQE